MTTTEASVQIPAGVWDLDPSHSSVNFSARHLMVSKVRGRFTSFSGSITIADDPLRSSVTASIDAASIDSRDEKRDGHLKSPDFLDVDQHPTLTFASSAVRPDGDGSYTVHGDLTIRGTTRPVTLSLEYNGVQTDPWGGIRIGFDARTELSRKDFGLEWNVPLDGGGVLVGDKITIELEIEAVKK